MITFAGSVSHLSRGFREISHELLQRRARNRIAARVGATKNPERRFVIAVDGKFGASPENCSWFDRASGKAAKGRNDLCLVVSSALGRSAWNEPTGARW